MAGYSVTVARDQRDFFSDRGRFFASFDNMSGIQFCQIIDKMFERDTRSAGIDPAGGMPWVTPVLGSGCLAVGGSEDVNPEQVGRAVQVAALALLAGDDAIDEDYEPDDLAQMAGEFAHALARERLLGDAELKRERLIDHDIDDLADREAPPNVEVSRDSASALVAAMLLNSTYHTFKAGAHTPPARGSDDVVAVGGKRSPDQRKLRGECQHQCGRLRARAERMRDTSSQPTEWDAIASLLQEIGDDFQQARVSLRNVGLLSEVAWYLLMREAGVYPGWNDLLFELMLIDDRQQEASERPWFKNLGEVGEKTRSLFARPTLRSWRDRADSSSRAAGARRSEFFDAVAELLRAQALTRSRAPLGFKPPVATAFVTSFDVELEMSLHQRLDADDRIYVVFPVQVRPNADSKQAKLCWLRARLDRPMNELDGRPKNALGGNAEDGLSRFLTPTSWQIVWPNLEDDFDQVHLIHLAGCPLLELPSVVDEPGFFKDLALRLTDSAIEFDAKELVLSHAVVVDEYLALQQSEAEMLWAVVHKNEPDSSLALPALFTGSDSADAASSPNPRFWMAMGVPLDDPAVRNRVITQLTIRRLLIKVGNHASLADISSAPVGQTAAQPQPEPAAGDFGGMAAAIGAVPNSASRQPERKQIFVSYSSGDDALARQVVGQLEGEGFTCWFAPNDVAPGRDHTTVIPAAIREADSFLLLLTPESDRSRDVKRELKLFTDRSLDNALYVVAVDGYKPVNLEYLLTDVQRVSLPTSQPFVNSTWERFVAHLRASIPTAERESTTARPLDREVAGTLGSDARVGGSLVGVVVNRRVHRDDAGMLHWLGLDVVCDDAADFTGDIRHLAAHMRSGQQNWNVPENRPCELTNRDAAVEGVG